MLQYLYLNQILEFTKGRLGPQQILHAASNEIIKLYAHTPELKDLASRISPISADDCAIIEREYNACISFEDSNFADCSFKLVGAITDTMLDGSVPFVYFLGRWDEPCTLTRMSWWEPNEEGIEYAVKMRVSGSDFVVFKKDLEALLNSSGTNNHGGAREDIDTRERTTYLKLIRMLCELQDIDISQPYKAYEVLAELAASKGIALPGSENNIATKLKAARDID